MKFYTWNQRFIEWLNSFCLWFARLLPKRLLYWCFIEGGAIATTGKYGTTDPTELSFMDALKIVGVETGIGKPQAASPTPEEQVIQQREQGLCWQCNSSMVVEMLDCPNCGAAYDGSRSHAREFQPESQSWLDPTPEMLRSPEFQAVWRAIHDWDISAPRAYMGRCGATGNHVAAILYALQSIRADHEIC